MINFIKNIWKFRKALWEYRGWDYSYTLHFLEICLTDLSNSLQYEVPESRLKKIAKINRCVEIIKRKRDDIYFDEWDETQPIQPIWELEQREWEELWDTIKGQGLMDSDTFEELFDGSDMRGWWD
jgi:hypothetical protein